MQVGENYSHLFNLIQNLRQSSEFNAHFSFKLYYLKDTYKSCSKTNPDMKTYQYVASCDPWLESNKNITFIFFLVENVIYREKVKQQ